MFGEHELLKKLMALIENIAKLITILLLISVVLQVISRFVGIPLRWTVELSRILFTWLGFFGLVIAIKNNTVPRITFYNKRLSDKNVYVLRIFSNIIVLVFLFFLFFASLDVVIKAHDQSMSVIPIKWSFVYISLTISIVLIFILITARTKKEIEKFKETEKQK